VNGAPKVQKTAGRERTLIGQSLSNVGLGKGVGTPAKQRPTPDPSATLHRETRSRHGQKSLPKLPRLAVTANNTARKNGSGCEGQPQKPKPESQTPRPANSPAKTTCPESRAGIGSPGCRQKAE